MTGLVAVRGRAAVPMADGDVLALVGDRPLAVDVGTGDGRYAYALARSRPDWFVVGLDASADAMRESSTKAARKPAKGGLGNLLYVWASVESAPAVLVARADEVTVVLPWGRLMSGLLVADPAVVGGVAGLGRAGATVRVVLNGEVWGDPVPVEARDLPEPTVALVEDVLAPAWAASGLRVDEVRWLAAEETATVGTTWAKRLSHGRPHPRFLCVVATVVPPPA